MTATNNSDKTDKTVLTERQLTRFRNAVGHLHSEALNLPIRMAVARLHGTDLYDKIFEFQSSLRNEPDAEQMTEAEALAWLNPRLKTAADIRITIDPTSRVLHPHLKL